MGLRVWKWLLGLPSFINDLNETNVFIASPHERESGYYKSVFDYCEPEVVIISDKTREFRTQGHDLYSKHAIGVNFSKTILAPKIRKVLTTRNDGNITISGHCGRSYINYGM
jgi:hypothetical protein